METNKVIEKLLKENDLGIMELSLYMDSIGYVTMTKKEHDKIPYH